MPDYSPGTSEMLVNQATTGNQEPTSIVRLADGSYLITSSTTEGEGQLFGSDGSKLGGPIDFSGADQGAVVATALAGGGFVVTWVQGDGNAQNANVATFRIYDGAGVATGPAITVGAAGTPTLPAAFALPTGNFVATWTVGFDRFAQVFSSQGQQVSAQFEIHEASIVQGLTGGGFVEFYGITQLHNVHAAFYDASGALVRDIPIQSESDYVATPLAGGGLVVVQDRMFPPRKWVVEIYDSQGQEVAEVVHDDIDIVLSNALALPGGGFAVMQQIGSARSLALFDSLGQADGTIPVPASVQRHSTLTQLDDGNILVTWSQNNIDNDVKAIAIDLDGTVGTVFTVSEVTAGEQVQNRVVALANGDFAVTWADDSGIGGDASGFAVKERFFVAAGPQQFGTSGNDMLAGSAPGARDTMIGLAGDDIYLVDNAGDIVEEAVGGGFDTVRASVSYTLTSGSEVELLTTADPSGTGAINLTGNEFAQTIIGNAGANVLRGQAGNDTYHVDVNDTVLEDAGEGVDTVLASESYGLVAGSHVEALATTDAAGTAAINLFGNEIAQTITGNAGANYLFGRGGADTLIGLGGDDFLFVETGATVIEAAGGGYDNVLAGSDYGLNAGAQVEILSTTNHAGTAAINLFGNEFGQIIIGNAGANYLFGRGGADALVGNGGDDFLYVDADDSVVEANGGGYDNVLASESYTLSAGAYVEILSTTSHSGTAAIDLTGNELGQIIIGNAGGNQLRGGGGADALVGNGGDDFLFVDGDDSVVEAAGGGYDNVLASQSFTLTAGAHAEILSTTDHGGTLAINLTGNELGQIILGNAGNNILNGGGGADALAGFGGIDHFQFTTALGSGNIDTLIGFDADDVIQLDDAVFAGLATGALNANAFFVGTAAHDADDRIIYDGSTGALFYDADGNGSGAAVQFATLQGAPALTASDFSVI